MVVRITWEPGFPRTGTLHARTIDLIGPVAVAGERVLVGGVTWDDEQGWDDRQPWPTRWSP